MKYILSFCVVYFVIFIGLYLGFYWLRLKRETLGTNRAFRVLVKKYDLKMNKERVKYLSKLLVLVNTFIIAIPVTLFLYVDMNYFLILLISFVIFMILLLTSYKLIGVMLKKKGW